MTVKTNAEREKILHLIEKAIKLLCEKSYSQVVVLSSYKINSVLKENFGVDIRVDKIGRLLSNIAKRNKLNRLNTKIPKYKLNISKFSTLKFF